MSISQLGERAEDNRMISLEAMLEQALADVRSGEIKANRALVLFLQDEDDDYDVCWRAANISCSEILALTEVAKSLALGKMDYV